MAQAAKVKVYRQPVDEPGGDWFYDASSPDRFLRFAAAVQLRSLTVIRGQVVLNAEFDIERLTVIDGRWPDNPDVNDHAVIVRGGGPGRIGQLVTAETGGHALDLVGGAHNVTVEHFLNAHRPTDQGAEPPGWPKNWPIHVDAIYVGEAHDCTVRNVASIDRFRDASNAVVWWKGPASSVVVEDGWILGQMHGLNLDDADACGGRRLTVNARKPLAVSRKTTNVVQDTLTLVDTDAPA